MISKESIFQSIIVKKFNSIIGLEQKRNEFCSTMFIANLLLIVIILTLQVDSRFAIEWPLSDENKKIDPIGMTFLIFFISILILQMIGMVYHRMTTLVLVLAAFKPRGEDDITTENNDRQETKKIIK